MCSLYHQVSLKANLGLEWYCLEGVAFNFFNVHAALNYLTLVVFLCSFTNTCAIIRANAP